MTTRFFVGDVFARMAELDDHSIDLICCSPPFLALRSYLPDDHPDKALEIGSEQTPADYLDVLLALTAEWRRLLAPHGSIAIELGDKYAGSGGAGGDYDPDGWRAGQNHFGSVAGRAGMPLDQSLLMIPTLYSACLAYGRNLLTGQPSPAGRWRIRNLRPWIRSNPPVGALGKKVRPATSYITVACVGADRWHDLDAVRTPAIHTDNGSHARSTSIGHADGARRVDREPNAAGAPPLDWLVDADTILDHELAYRATVDNRSGQDPSTRTAGVYSPGEEGTRKQRSVLGASSVGARGVHLRRALQVAGILPSGPEADYYDISPRGYTGAHYAVWPPQLVKLLIAEMCPRRVCVVCGEPSRRIVDVDSDYQRQLDEFMARRTAMRYEDSNTRAIFGNKGYTEPSNGQNAVRRTISLGWSDCGHDAWRPGMVLDPFVGSGTTLSVASGMGRDSIGIDLDERNADLARERVGMFLEVDYPTREATG